MKSGMLFSFFFVGVQEKRNIYFTKKRKKKRRFLKKCGNWDLISLPCGSSFIHFTDVDTHFHVKLSTL